MAAEAEAPKYPIVDDLQRLLAVLMQDLLGNAWKFTSKHPRAGCAMREHTMIRKGAGTLCDPDIATTCSRLFEEKGCQLPAADGEARHAPPLTFAITHRPTTGG